MARSGQNTLELANGPAQRIQPFVETHRAAGAAGGEKQSPLRELLRGAGERFRGQIARFRAEKCLLFMHATTCDYGDCGTITRTEQLL